MKLIIATPFYEMKAFSPYVTSLVQSLMILQRLGIDYTMVGAAVTLGFSTQSGDVVYALYFKV